jgi:hypothetical protein
MCDQVVSLISPEHAQTIIWSEKDREDEDEDEDEDDMLNPDASARMVKFEVAETNKKEDSVTVRKGFEVNSSLVVLCTGGSADKFGIWHSNFRLFRMRLLVQEPLKIRIRRNLSRSRHFYSLVRRPKDL